MLILKRRKRQSIYIDDKIKIVVLDISDRNIAIGIDAPEEMAILRDELYTKGKQNGK